MTRIFLRPSRIEAPWSAKLVIADDRIGAELPQHQVGLGGDHGGIETLEHVADFLAVGTAIEHGDRTVGEMLLELYGEPVRIIRRRGAGARAGSRRRTDGDDGDRLAGRELVRNARQRIGEPDQVERRIACGRCRLGARRQRQHQAGDERGDSDRLHRPIGEISDPARQFPPALD